VLRRKYAVFSKNQISGMQHNYEALLMTALVIAAKSGKQMRIGFEPLAFEKKYTGMRPAAEVVTYQSGGTSMNDLQRLIEKYEKRMAELEAQIGALRNKHDILVEAARLLEEEAQAPDVTSQ
jgi:hypothetical protein